MGRGLRAGAEQRGEDSASSLAGACGRALGDLREKTLRLHSGHEISALSAESEQARISRVWSRRRKRGWMGAKRWLPETSVCDLRRQSKPTNVLLDREHLTSSAREGRASRPPTTSPHSESASRSHLPTRSTFRPRSPSRPLDSTLIARFSVASQPSSALKLSAPWQTTSTTTCTATSTRARPSTAVAQPHRPAVPPRQLPPPAPRPRRARPRLPQRHRPRPQRPPFRALLTDRDRRACLPRPLPPPPPRRTRLCTSRPARRACSSHSDRWCRPACDRTTCLKKGEPQF